MSAKSRATLALQAITSLNSDDALQIVKDAVGRVKGGGASLLTTGIQNVGAQIHVEREQPGRLELSINSGKRIVELCTFTATAAISDSKTILRVGGLNSYKTSQSTILGFIPAGPKMIAGMSPYRRFLDEISSGLRAADGTAQVSVVRAVPGLTIPGTFNGLSGNAFGQSSPVPAGVVTCAQLAVVPAIGPLPGRGDSGGVPGRRVRP